MVESNEGLTAARVPLKFPKHFSWAAVAVVMAEKFGLRGLRITAMIGAMVGYFWSSDSFAVHTMRTSNNKVAAAITYRIVHTSPSQPRHQK